MKKREKQGRVDVGEDRCAHVARYNITLRAHLSPFSALFSYAKPSSPPIVHCGITSLGPVSTTPRLFSRHLLPPFSSSFSSFCSSPPLSLSHSPYRLTRDASLHHPFSLPLLCPFISSTSVFGSKPRPFVPFQRHADKWISLLIKSFTRPPFFFRSSHPPLV